MKILIIGSKGFIGSHCYRFFSSRYKTWGADIFEDKDEKYFLINKTTPNFETIFEAQNFDICINASGNGSVPISINSPVFDFELNVTNTIKILDAVRMHNPLCRFINLSSAAVYGNPLKLPIREDSSIRPLSPYGWHKLYAEQVCKEYYYLYNLQTINLRIFSVYGENLRKQLFWDMYQKYIRSKKIELFGTGAETRDFIYIQDLMQALDCVIEKGLFNGEVVNVASGEETTIATATEIFSSILDKKIEITFNEITKPGDPTCWKADIDILRSFGFEAKTSIEQGLKNTVKWLLENK